MLSPDAGMPVAVIIPEPATYGMIGVAGLMLLLVIRRVMTRAAALSV